MKMDLKTKFKRFFTLKRKANDGFTLVELIVVIAILAILGGVGVPAYSGYVKKANMQADISLASEVGHALTLAYYNQQLPNGGSVVLTKDGATGSDEYVDAALVAAFGSVNNVGGLKYDEWGNGVAVAKEVVDYFVNGTYDEALKPIFDGSANISYTDNIPELFDLVEDTAIQIAGKRESLGSGATMMTNAANITNSIQKPNNYEGTNAEYFSELWASSAWDSNYFMGKTDVDYSGDTSTYTTDEQLNYAIANAGVIKARNVALATYLSDLGYVDTANAISNYTYNNSVVPADAAGVILKSMNEEEMSEEEWSFVGTAFPEDDTEFQAVASAIQKYYSTENGQSQAYTDGLAYYGMMSTVDSLKDSANLDTTDDSTWWNDLYSAVDLYSDVANGSADLNNLNALYSGISAGGNSVVAMLTVKDGTPNVIITPVAANP